MHTSTKQTMFLFILLVSIFLFCLLLASSFNWYSKRPAKTSKHFDKKVLDANSAHIKNKKSVSDHQKYPVPSKKLDKYFHDQLNLLEAWSKYCIEQNIIYSVVGGAVIGYYCHRTLLPWDDDIDVAVPEIHEYRLKDLWENGMYVNFFAGEWEIKQISLNGEQPTTFYLGKYNNTEGWYKLLSETYVTSKWYKLNSLSLTTKDVGGLDINVAKIAADGKWVEKPFPQNRVCDMTDLINVKLHGLNVRMPSKKNAYEFLDVRYGTQWRKDIIVSDEPEE